MTEKECLAAGIAVSLFAHFALLIAPRPPEPEPSFTTVVQMDMASRSCLGKLLVGDILKNQMTPELKEKFLKQFDPDRSW